MKKILFAITKILFAITLIAILYFLWPSFHLVKTADRTYPEYPLSKQLKERIAKETAELPYDIGVIEYSFWLTNELLEFSEKNDIENGKANCIGYTRFYTSVCNYALTVNEYEGRVKPVVGYVTWCGLNLCDIAKFIVPKKYKGFVKDHDFVELEYDDRYVYIDPTFYDMMGSECTTEVNKCQ